MLVKNSVTRTVFTDIAESMTNKLLLSLACFLVITFAFVKFTGVSEDILAEESLKVQECCDFFKKRSTNIPCEVFSRVQQCSNNTFYQCLIKC